MTTDVSQATIDEATADARRMAASLLASFDDRGYKRAGLARDAARDMAVLRLLEGDPERAYVYAKASALLTELYVKALGLSLASLVRTPPPGGADRLLSALRAVPDSAAHPSSSQAGLAAIRAGARLTRPACAHADAGLPSGHRLEDACEACVPDGPVPSLVALAARHYPEQCVSAASCTCACDSCTERHNPEGA